MVESVRKAGASVAFVSDMYLDSVFLRSLLEREKLILPGDRLLVSVECKASKASGSIWSKVLEDLNTVPDNILHHGDNPHGDVISPRQAGLRAKRLGTAETSRWEAWDRGHGPEDIRRFGGLAALSRMARAGLAEPDDYWISLGAGVLGPLLAGFAQWVLDRAKRDEIGSLWFLSRDGWLLREAARLFEEPNSPKLEYLCCGRRQLFFATSGEVGTNINDLFGGSRLVSLELIGSRLAFDQQDLLELQRESGLEDIGISEKLDESARSKIGGILVRPEWEGRIHERRRKAGEPIRCYLKQMAGRAADRIAVVDVGWRGSSQDLLGDALIRLQSLSGYYLGLAGEGPASSGKQAWLYNRPANSGNLALDRHQRLFEVLLGGSTGPLQGYQEVESEWLPVFAEKEKGEYAPGREGMQEAALAFVKLAADPSYRGWWKSEDIRDFTNRNLIRLFEKPTKEDALHFAKWWVTTDEAHADSVQLAGGYDVARIKRCLLQGEAWAWLWPKASLRNSSLIGGWVMRLASRMRG